MGLWLGFIQNLEDAYYKSTQFSTIKRHQLSSVCSGSGLGEYKSTIIEVFSCSSTVH